MNLGQNFGLNVSFTVYQPCGLGQIISFYSSPTPATL